MKRYLNGIKWFGSKSIMLSLYFVIYKDYLLFSFIKEYFIQGVKGLGKTF